MNSSERQTLGSPLVRLTTESECYAGLRTQGWQIHRELLESSSKSVGGRPNPLILVGVDDIGSPCAYHRRARFHTTVALGLR